MSKLFDLESFKRGKFAVNCRTEKEAFKLLSYLNSNNIKWCDNKKILSDGTHWENYKEETCYSTLYGMGYSPTDFYIAEEYIPVYPYQYFTFPEPEQIKSEQIKPDDEIKVGDWVMVRVDLVVGEFYGECEFMRMLQSGKGKKGQIAECIKSPKRSNQYNIPAINEWFYTTEMLIKISAPNEPIKPEPKRPDMKLIAQAFGVELGERFNLIDLCGNKISNCPYQLTDCGLIDCNNNKKNMYDSIIIGLYQIEKIPQEWKPKDGIRYYYYAPNTDRIECTEWLFDGIDLARYAIQNYFKTHEQAEQHKAEVMARFDAIRKELEQC